MAAEGNGAQGRENRRAETLRISRHHLPDKEMMFRITRRRCVPSGRGIDSALRQSAQFLENTESAKDLHEAVCLRPEHGLFERKLPILK